MMATQSAPRSPFIGRRTERAYLQDTLTNLDVRLLTVTGPGGIGKTRLALEVASDLAPEFSNGADFISLVDVRDVDLVLATIARALGMPTHGPAPLFDRLSSRLANAELLLVLDNLEQVVSVGPELVRLLEACPGVTVLATSRVPLRVPGEHVLTLSPLKVPDLDRLPKIHELGTHESVALLVQRARAADPEFALTESNAADVAQICAHLEGLPLAIELAAARLQILSPAALLERLASPLELLSRGERHMPERHRALRNVIAWSDDLLSPTSRAIFYGFSVFAGGAEAAAVDAVCLDRPDPPDLPDLHALSGGMLDALAELLDHGLLRRETFAGEPRFGMPETICEYALERLEGTGAAERVRRRHARYFLALATDLAPRLPGPDPEHCLARLEREQHNFRAALTWSLAHDPELGLQLAAALWRFWYARGYVIEGQHWLRRALAAPAGEKHVARVRALNGLGVLLWAAGDLERALGLQSASLALARAIDDDWGVAAAEGDRAIIEFMQGGDEARAREATEAALGQFRALGDRFQEGLSLSALGSIAQNQGNLIEATSRFQEALAVTRQSGDLGTQALCLFNLGQVARLEGDLDQSAAYHHQSLTLSHRLGMQEDRLYSLAGIAGIAVARQVFERAARLLGAVSAIVDEIGIPLQPVEKSQFDRDVETAKAALGAERFARAWEAGRRLDLEDAVAEAWALSQAPDRYRAEQEVIGAHPNGYDPGEFNTNGHAIDHFKSRHGLSLREIEVLRLLVAGKSDREIAETLFISAQTATTHVKHVRAKLGVHSRAAAAAYAIRHGIA